MNLNEIEHIVLDEISKYDRLLDTLRDSVDSRKKWDGSFSRYRQEMKANPNRSRWDSRYAVYYHIPLTFGALHIGINVDRLTFIYMLPCLADRVQPLYKNSLERSGNIVQRDVKDSEAKLRTFVRSKIKSLLEGIVEFSAGHIKTYSGLGYGGEGHARTYYMANNALGRFRVNLENLRVGINPAHSNPDLLVEVSKRVDDIYSLLKQYIDETSDEKLIDVVYKPDQY